MGRFTFPTFTNVWGSLVHLCSRSRSLSPTFGLMAENRQASMEDCRLYLAESRGVGNIRSSRSGSPTRRNQHGGKGQVSEPKYPTCSSFLSLINTARRGRFAEHLYGASSRRIPLNFRGLKKTTIQCVIGFGMSKGSSPGLRTVTLTSKR